MKWIDSVAPLAPSNLTAQVQDSTVKLNWDKPLPASNGDTAFKYVVYRFNYMQPINVGDARHILKILNRNETVYSDTTTDYEKSTCTYVVTALDRLSNESDPAVINLTLKGR
jgi:hypothetical protein